MESVPRRGRETVPSMAPLADEIFFEPHCLGDEMALRDGVTV